MINQNGISSETRYAEPGKEKKTDGAVFLLGVMVNAVRNDIFFDFVDICLHVTGKDDGQGGIKQPVCQHHRLVMVFQDGGYAGDVGTAVGIDECLSVRQNRNGNRIA